MPRTEVSVGPVCTAPNSQQSECASSSHEDAITEATGAFGRWQLGLTFLLSLFNVPCTWHIFVFTFQSVQLDYWCDPPSDRADLHNLSHNQWRDWSQPPYESTVTRKKRNSHRFLR